MGQMKSGIASKIELTGERTPPCARSEFNGQGERDPSAMLDERNGRLWHMIECEIIPRLMMAHSLNGSVKHGDGKTNFDVPDFTALVLTEDETAVLSHIDALCARGLSADSICAELLAPTVSRLKTLLDDHILYGSNIGAGLERVEAALARLGRRQLS